jgi:hypothetical protein
MKVFFEIPVSTSRPSFENSDQILIQSSHKVTGPFKWGHLALCLNIPNINGHLSKNYVIVINSYLAPVSHTIFELLAFCSYPVQSELEHITINVQDHLESYQI